MASVHDGHRARLKQRFRESGLDNFHDINVLELLLFYAMPRQDTNPIAHRLLERFHTLAGVLDAPYEELCKIDGIGDNAALLLKLIPQLLRRYQLSMSDGEVVLDTTTKAGQYLIPYFFGERDEVVYLLCLDAKCKVLDCRELFRGGVTSAPVSARKIIEVALACNAVSVILAHNHTSGIALPSRDDEVTTRAIQKALDTVDIYLADHIVVADNDFVSMADNGFFRR